MLAFLNTHIAYNVTHSTNTRIHARTHYCTSRLHPYPLSFLFLLFLLLFLLLLLLSVFFFLLSSFFFCLLLILLFPFLSLASPWGSSRSSSEGHVHFPRLKMTLICPCKAQGADDTPRMQHTPAGELYTHKIHICTHLHTHRECLPSSLRVESNTTVGAPEHPR